MAFHAGKTIVQPAIPPTVLVDRTGAGDVAAAGFIAGELKALDLGGCLEVAAAAASKSIEGYGRTAYPDRAFLEKCVEERIRSAGAPKRAAPVESNGG